MIMHTFDKIKVGSIYKGSMWDENCNKHTGVSLLILREATIEEYLEQEAVKDNPHLKIQLLEGAKFYEVSTD